MLLVLLVLQCGAVDPCRCGSIALEEPGGPWGTLAVRTVDIRRPRREPRPGTHQNRAFRGAPGVSSGWLLVSRRAGACE